MRLATMGEEQKRICGRLCLLSGKPPMTEAFSTEDLNLAATVGDAHHKPASECAAEWRDVGVMCAFHGSLPYPRALVAGATQW